LRSEVAVGHRHCALQFRHHALGTLIAQLLHATLQLLTESRRQHAGPIAIGITDRQVENFGFAELGTSRRPHVNVVAKALNIQFSWPLGGATAIAGWPHLTQCGLYHTLTLGEFEDGFLQSLHFRQVGELAEPLFRNTRCFGPDDEGLRRTPFTGGHQTVGTSQDRKDDSRHRPPADVGAEQANEIGWVQCGTGIRVRRAFVVAIHKACPELGMDVLTASCRRY
jgi:hypothetical protein